MESYELSEYAERQRGSGFRTSLNSSPGPRAISGEYDEARWSLVNDDNDRIEHQVSFLGSSVRQHRFQMWSAGDRA